MNKSCCCQHHCTGYHCCYTSELNAVHSSPGQRGLFIPFTYCQNLFFPHYQQHTSLSKKSGLHCAHKASYISSINFLRHTYIPSSAAVQTSEAASFNFQNKTHLTVEQKIKRVNPQGSNTAVNSCSYYSSSSSQETVNQSWSISASSTRLSPYLCSLSI